jgi:hypothetical protein
VDIAHKTGLILIGGGAGAAYQAGVLQAISRILAEAGWPAARNPFAIVCGTSAGAINATGLAWPEPHQPDPGHAAARAAGAHPAASGGAAGDRAVRAPRRHRPRHTHDLPGPVRTLLAGIGATEERGAALASYRLFEPGYTRELMALGREDTYARRDDVLEFFA